MGNISLIAQTMQPAVDKKNGQSAENTKDTIVYRFTDVPPIPPDGSQEFYQYLSQNMGYPQIAIDSGISGRVAFQFAVETDGSLDRFAILKDIGGGCGAEVLKVIKAFPGKWIPAQNEGTPVPSYYTGTFKFDLKQKVSDDQHKDNIFDQHAVPNKGLRKFQKYLEKHTEFPPEASKAGISGRIVYQFAVDTSGHITDVQILKDIGGGCGDAVKKVLKEYPGQWTPAMYHGHPVKSYYAGTFNFNYNPKEEVNNPVYRFTDKSAEPPGGIYAFYRYLSEHTTYPLEARKAGVSGKVAYQFIVDTSGRISNIKILKGPGFGCNEAVRETLERYHTHWIPASNNGHPVNCYYTGVFNFSLK